MMNDINSGDLVVAPLSFEETKNALEFLSKKLSKCCGVTIAQDYNGAYGIAGRTHMTLRYKFNDEFYTATFELQELSCFEQNLLMQERMEEDK